MPIHPAYAPGTLAAGDPLPVPQGPVRTCIGCGGRAAQRELARLRLLNGEVVVDRARSGGRGAWLHPGSECLERAIKRRALGRAFRAPDARAEPRVLRDLLTGNTRKD